MALKKRNPNWTRDEIILALDLYFELNSKNEEPSNPKVRELSLLLNKLSNSDNKLDSFRNPDGVSMKLQNLRFFDPNRTGGLPAGSELDELVLNEYYNDRQRLKEVAYIIKSSLDKPNLIVPDIDDLEVKEGKRIQRIHFSLERNRKIVSRKKAKVLEHEGKLDCEVCQFDFYKVYGELGKTFIECHHKIPLYLLQPNSPTRLIDLALVCSNCHRMLHRGDHLSVEDLKMIIKKKN